MEICASRSLLKILPFVAAFMLCNSPSTAADTADSCLACHASAAKMTELGYPHFTVTQNEVETQSGMTAGCADCHLGNRLEGEREKAHQGMGRLLLIRKKGLVAETAERKLPLEIGGNAMLRLKYQVAKDGKPAIDPGINNLLYQDKRRDTLSQDFAFMEKSCGACHKREFAEFRKSTMGRNAKQSRYRSDDITLRIHHGDGAHQQSVSDFNTRAPRARSGGILHPQNFAHRRAGASAGRGGAERGRGDVSAGGQDHRDRAARRD